MFRLVSILVAVPAFVLAVLIYLYGCNLPYWDQWEEYDLFHLVQLHTLTIQDLFAQHNEHRLFFPRLFLIFATIFTPYNDLAELWISWILACLSSVCLWRMSRSTGWSGLQGLLLLAGANVMLFNLLAWEDWLWGFQIGFLLPVLCVIAGAWSVSVSRGAWQFFWAAWWSTINSFTIASGFTTWIVLVPLLLFPDGTFRFRWKGLLAHFLGFGLCLFLYLHGYVKPGGHPSTSGVLNDPLGAVNYFLVYLGAPLADTSPPGDDFVLWTSFAAGTLLLGLYMTCMALLVFFRNQPRLLTRALPWLTLAHYGLCTAAITTVGRMGFGLGQALSSRYVVLSSLVPIGLLFGGACLFPAWVSYLKAQRNRQFLGVLVVALPVLCFAFYLWSVANALIHWQEIYQNRTRTKAALVFVNVPAAAPLLTNGNGAYPDIKLLKGFIEERSKLGCPQVVLRSSVISDLADSSPVNPLSGEIAKISQESQGLTVSGWAFLPKANRPADLILLTLPDAENHDSIIGMAFPDGYDQAIGEKIQCPENTPLKWVITLPTGTKLTGLKAWSFDDLTNRAYQMPGMHDPLD
jgi:hypothetical protein